VAPLGYLVSRVFQRVPLSQDHELIGLFSDIPHGMTLDIPKFLFDLIVVVPGPVENVRVYPDDQLSVQIRHDSLQQYRFFVKRLTVALRVPSSDFSMRFPQRAHLFVESEEGFSLLYLTTSPFG
jgi:hypothetical protein